MARRLFYKTPEEMQVKIDEYFDTCAGRILTDENGEVILNKYGEPIILGAKPPTVTGLALALGFTSRMALLKYQGRGAFKDVVTRAKARVEAYTEERLFDKDGANGAKFSLQFNFKGWREEKSDENSGPVINIINDIPRSAEPCRSTDDGEEATREIMDDPQAISAMIKELEQGGK